MTTLVVGGDGNIDVLGGRVGVAKSDDGNVDVRGLLDGLGIGAGIGDDDQTGLLERTGDVVGEGTGREATSNGLSTGVSGELQDGTLTVGTSRDNADISRVVNGGDDAGSKDDLLPVRLLVSVMVHLMPQHQSWCQAFAPFFSMPPNTKGRVYQVFEMLMTDTPSARVFHT